MKEIKAGDLEGLMADKIDGAAAYVDGSLSNEELGRIKDLFGEKVYSLRPVNAPIPSTARIEDLKTAGTIVVFRLDLDAQYGALGSLIKRRAAMNEAGLILVDAPENTFAKLPGKRLGSSEFLAGIKGLTGTDDCLLVYRDLEDKERDALSSLEGMRFLWLPPETNTLGLARLGIEHAAPKGKALFFFGKDIPEVAIEDGTFVACFSPYENRLTRRADLVVPIRDGFEREGTFYNLEGEIVRRMRVLSPRPARIDLNELLVRMLPKG
jgi:formate dehydrogenase major subunit